MEGKLAHSSTYKNAILSQEGEPARLDKGYYQGREKDKYEILFSEKEKYQEKAVSDEILEKNIEAWARKMFAAYGIKEEGSTFFGCLADLAIKLQQSS